MYQSIRKQFISHWTNLPLSDVNVKLINSERFMRNPICFNNSHPMTFDRESELRKGCDVDDTKTVAFALYHIDHSTRDISWSPFESTEAIDKTRIGNRLMSSSIIGGKVSGLKGWSETMVPFR